MREMGPAILRPTWGLVLGGAKELWDDVEALEALLHGPWPGVVVATNNAGVDWPKFIDHWVTRHPEKLHGIDPDGTGDWIRKRKENGFPGGYKTWGRRAPKLVDEVVDDWGGGSSGFLSLRVLRHLGCRRAVLCGVPMTVTPHYHGDQKGKDWRHADLHWRSWIRHIHRVEGWARSMSGRSAERLGVPDLDWLLAK